MEQDGSKDGSRNHASAAKVETDVVVIGGGIAGLTCGVGLSQHGLRVTLLESTDLLGGRARSWTDETTGDRVDIGPHIMLSEYRNMMRLLKILGTDDRIAWQEHMILADDPYPVKIVARHLPPPLHFLPSILKVPQLSWLDMLSNLRVLWQALRLERDDILRLDNLNARDYLRSMGVSQHAIDWFWQSAAMTILNVPAEHCSAGALLQFMSYMIGRSGYQVGFADVGLGDLFAPQAARLIAAAGGEVRMNSEVTALRGTQEQVTEIELSDGSRLTARWCIATVPPQHLQPLLPAEWVLHHQVFKDLGTFEPSPYISTYLWFDRKLTPERFWTRVWSPTNMNYDFYDLSNIRQGWNQRPSLIVGNTIYSHRVEHLTDEEIVQNTLKELAEYLPEAAGAQVLHQRVHRIPMAKSAPHPGIEHIRPKTRSPIKNLLLAGDWIDTQLPGSMESAVRAGWLAAEAVLEAEGRPASLSERPPETESLARLIGGRLKARHH